MSVIDIAPAADLDPARVLPASAASTGLLPSSTGSHLPRSRYVPSATASIEELVARDIEAYSQRRRRA